MAIKIRELKKLLKQSGFIQKAAKGSHTKWIHPNFKKAVIISGKDSSDAKPYLEKQIIEVIEQLKNQGDIQ